MIQETHIGFGALKHLAPMIAARKAERIFLVTGQGSFEASGAREAIIPLLGERVAFHFDSFSPNPKLNEIEEGVAHARSVSPDLFVAVGGGSAIDVAKAIAYLSTQEEGTEHPSLPCIAIPTTAGTGTEATHFAVYYQDGIKQSLAYPSMLPAGAIVDPSLLRSVSAPVMASTGTDALAQAIEAYWSVQSNEESKAYSKEAIDLIIRNLELAVTTPNDEALLAMATGAHIAGKAINLAKTTACHAISYPITSRFGVPHGHAVGLTLPSMMVFNAGVSDADVTDSRGASYVRDTVKEIAQFLGAATPDEAAEQLTKLMTDIGLATRLSNLGISSDEERTFIVESSFDPDRMKNNPRTVTKKALASLLETIA